MSLEVVFRRGARSEFLEAVSRYETQRTGLGTQFVTEIERCVALAAEQPQLYTQRQNVRRVVAERFPYSVYFRAEAKRIVVLAVFHSSRDPAIWQRRV